MWLWKSQSRKCLNLFFGVIIDVLQMYNANSYNRISFFYVRINIIDRYNLLCIIYSQILTGAWGMDFVSPSTLFSTTPPFPPNFHINHSFFKMFIIIRFFFIRKFWKGNDLYKNFEKRGVVEKRGRRKRNPCPIRLCLNEQLL